MKEKIVSVGVCLQFRFNTDTKKRYFYCKYGDESCYIGRIEDIDEIMQPKSILPLG